MEVFVSDFAYLRNVVDRAYASLAGAVPTVPGLGTKQCARCREVKPWAAFRYYGAAKDKCLRICRTCERIPVPDRPARQRSARRRQEASPRASQIRSLFDARLMNEYGLSREAYDALVIAQSGRCAICALPKPLFVDHHHGLGHVRGLLCSQCNTGLGVFFDSTANLESACRYLRADEAKW